MCEVEVSAVLPVYNDLSALKVAIPRSLETLEAIAPGGFEVIVAEDGSTDGSAEFVGAYEADDPRVRLLHADERLGRGRALNRAFAAAKGSIVCYYDVDLATDMQHLTELVGAIRDGCDVATGSRLLAESTITRSGGREIASRGYNMLVRTILGDENRILTVSSYIKSEIHGIGDVCIGVPARLNRNGVFPVPIRLEENEVAGFEELVKKIRKFSADVMERLEEAR